jgi:acyl-coenzyme A synthetase/AMP-(fatty) acid ligase
VFYAGRAGDMLEVGGISVSPIEVEAILTQSNTRLCSRALVGGEDDDELVKPHALVVLKDPSATSAALAEEMKGFVRDKIAPYKHPLDRLRPGAPEDG